MTANDVKAALNQVLINGVSLNATAYLVLVLGWIVASALGAFLGSFFGKRGETAALKRDLETIKMTLAQTTRVTEAIKVEVTGRSLLEQRRWDRKWECYVELVKNLGEVHTLIREAGTLDAGSPDYAREVDERRRQAFAALLKVRQFGSIARIAVASSVRTILTRFGDEWNKAAGSDERYRIVARWGWLVITDIARNDLFGEPREMSDEFTGAGDVPAPRLPSTLTEHAAIE